MEDPIKASACEPQVRRHSKKIHPAFIASWAAVVAAGYIIPALPIMGTGFFFSFANVLSPLSGIFFGPVFGALCTAIGGLIGSFIAPHTAWLGPFTFIISTTTAFTAGCIAWGKWPLAVIVYIVGSILWFTQEIGRSFIWFPIVFYGLGFLAMLTGLFLFRKLILSNNKLLKFIAIWIASFGGLVGGATIGNFFSLLLYETPKDVWKVLLIQSPIERAIFAFAAMIVGVPLMEGLKKIGIISQRRGGAEE